MVFCCQIALIYVKTVSKEKEWFRISEPLLIKKIFSSLIVMEYLMSIGCSTIIIFLVALSESGSRKSIVQDIFLRTERYDESNSLIIKAYCFRATITDSQDTSVK